MAKLTTEQWIEKARTIHKDKYDYSKVQYINSQTKVCIICPKHGEFWQIPNNHVRGAGCPKCKYEYVANLQRGTKESFIEKANKVHNNFYNYDKVLYGKNNKEKVIITCPKHGDFEQSPHDHLRFGCPKCHLKSQTKLYEKLKESFPNEKILFETKKEDVKWLNGQRFDIYFPKYNIAVEYNGEQHYIPKKYFGGEIGLIRTKERDELKRKKCRENNCILFEIKYDYSKEDYDNLITNLIKIINNYENYTKKLE